MINNNLPMNFTASEEYCGHVIAICDGYYHAFKNGNKTGAVAPTRFELRRLIGPLLSFQSA